MDVGELREKVRAHTAMASDAQLDAAIGATLGALGALVGPSHRSVLASALPETFRAAFVAARYDASAGRDAFVEAVARSEHVPEGPALEHATATLDALAQLLDPDLRGVLARELPEDVRDWLVPREEHAPGPRLRQSSHPPHHVSDGKPGSRHPVSESAPPPAQEGSVARSEEPHRDTKISSAPGPTQVREQETLADGQPGGERTPLAEGD
jgi:uncharacterized protein (DUF2267 family)